MKVYKLKIVFQDTAGKLHTTTGTIRAAFDDMAKGFARANMSLKGYKTISIEII